MKPEAWQYDELQQVGVNYDNLREVEKYDARMQKLRDIKTEIDALVEATAPTADSVVLEIGAGTGEFAIALAPLCKKICVADVSLAMLEYAQKKAAARKITNIEFRHAGFLTFEQPEEQFDIIFSQLALHHLPDFWKAVALKGVHALLKNGGNFYLKDVVYPSDMEDYDSYFNGIIKGIESSAGAEFTKEVIEHIKNEYSTLDWIMEDLLKKSGFTIGKGFYRHLSLRETGRLRKAAPKRRPGSGG